MQNQPPSSRPIDHTRHTWLFAVWGLDIVGPLRKALGDYTHLLVAIDKFSKWIEARPITNLRAELLTVYFGTPNMFITLWFGFDY
jgi:hypothetical protein